MASGTIKSRPNFDSGDAKVILLQNKKFSRYHSKNADERDYRDVF